MFTELNILKALHTILFALFTFMGAIVVERLMQRKICTRWAYALAAVINALLFSFLLSNVTTRFVFLSGLILLLIELIVLYRSTFINMLYCAMAVAINAMCFRGIVSSIVAAVMGVSFYTVYSIPDMVLFISTLTTIVEIFVLAALLKFAPLENMHDFIKVSKQKSFMIIWMCVCVLLMFGNASIYNIDYNSTAICLSQLYFCLGLISSCYFTLIFTYNLNKNMLISAKYEALSKEFVAQQRLQSVLINDSVFSCEANLTKNLILSGPEDYIDSFSSVDFNYDRWFEIFKNRIHPDDRDYFCDNASRDKLIGFYETSSEPAPFIYRRMGNDTYHWTKMVVRIFKDVSTGDIFVYGYAYDVDKEMLEKQELEYRAQTDSLTKLLNRATAENLITEEIKSGNGALFLMDIDDFKDINDCMGHSVGDSVLIRTAARLSEFFGRRNIVGRLGGDEFIAYLKNESDIEKIFKASDLLIEILCAPPDNPEEPAITISLGVAPVKDSAASFLDIYSQADSALYEVKYSGKRSFKVYGEHSQQ